MEKFVPQSPDPFLKKDSDMSLAKFGHINAIVEELNTVNATVTQIKTNVYANNAAAIAGGLTQGDFYSTATGEVRIVV
jgi:hypothetical protein